MDIVLVHGAYHGAWCWERLVPELERLGHRAIAVDLPIDDPRAAAAAYADAVAGAIPDGSRPVVVAHSMGGLVAPLVAERRPVRGLVFLAAFLPVPGVSANEQRRSEAIDPPASPTTAEWEDLGAGVWRIGPATATELFFHDLPPADAAWAIARLRPQAYGIFDEPSPLRAWPDVASAVIVCRDDRAINADWVRGAARERLRVEPVEIDGGHSPFLGRPAELAAHIAGAMPADGG